MGGELTDAAATGPAGERRRSPAGAEAPDRDASGALLAADGRPLKAALKRSERAARWRAFALVAPLLLFLCLVYFAPIGGMIASSVRNPEVVAAFPETARALQDWDGEGDAPPEAVFAALAADMAYQESLSRQEQAMGSAAQRLNRELPGARSTILRTARDVEEWEAPFRPKFLEADEDWADPQFWNLFARETRAVTPAFYLLALDYEYGPEGEVRRKPPEQRVFVDKTWFTFWMSLLVTGICVLLAYPIAYLMATLPARRANLLLILVLLPFWTSLLVRTSAWIVLLQREGVINDVLVWARLLGDEARLRMIYNATGTGIAMIHILLPFMVLPLYSVMKTINPSLLRAAVSLGSPPVRAWWRVYFPLTLPGLGAGCILVFILAIGYYITPAIVGGAEGTFISNLIASNIQSGGANARLAAALATMLLVSVLVVYWLFNRLVGTDKLKFG